MKRSKKIIGVIGGILTIIVITMFTKGGIFTKEVKLLNNENVSYLYKNPLGIEQIGDPFVLKTSEGKYYCYCTSADNGFRAWSSDDLINWKEEGYIYEKQKNSWGYKDFWAPEVVQYQGKYYMYYTARWTENSSLRNGVAISDSPLGPFKDIENKPFLDLGYAVIDPNVFVDEDGRKYLYYIKDCSENVVNGRHESHVYGVELDDDMISTKGEPILLTKPEQAWEMVSGPEWLWNEGSTVFKKNGIYYMTYSANYFSSKDYAIGYATSKSPLGPFVKYENNPIVKVESKWDDISGPGHNSITVSPDDKEFIMVYHTHTVPLIGGSDRQVCIDRMGFRKDGTMYVNGPTISEQLVPSGVEDIKNIALEAKIEVSKTEDGYSKEYINDGSISLYSRLEKNEWVNTDKDSYIKISWEKEKSIQSIMIYGSINDKRNIENGKIVFSNGKVIKDIVISNRPGEAAIYNFEAMDIEWIKLIIENDNDKEKENAISEIVVLGN